MLCYRDGFCRGWDSSTLLENSTTILYTSNIQLFVVLPSALRARTLSETSRSQVSKPN